MRYPPTSPLIKKLNRTLSWAARAEFYKKKLHNAHKAARIYSLDEFYTLPLIVADDLRKHSQSFSSVPKNKLYALYASGGTTGKPKLMYYNENALEGVAHVTGEAIGRLVKLDGRLVVMIVPGDNLAGVGEYTKRALRNLGAYTASMGLTYTADQSKQLVSVMQEEKPYMVIGNPARLTKLVADIKEQNIAPNSLGVKFILSTSEVLAQKTRDFFEKSFDAIVYQGGGMTEVGWSTMECKKRNGQHLLETVYAEVRDTETGTLVKNGFGELYLTTLINPAYPLVRYKTEDVVEIDSHPCECGNKTPRIWYRCRLTERINVGGVTLFAYHIDKALEKIHAVSGNYLLSVKRSGAKDSMTLLIETEKANQTITVKKMVQEKIEAGVPRLQDAILVGSVLKPTITFVDPETLKRTPRGKIANRISDERN